jgi:uncharacterized membrane protein YdbT with pleckstrin-like domain
MTDDEKKDTDKEKSSSKGSTPNDEPVVVNRSMWHNPMRLIGAFILTLAPLLLMFIYGQEWSQVFKYATLIVSGVGLLLLLWHMVETKITATYTITPERCTVEKGFIARSIHEVEIRHIRNINVHQGIFQRICGIGDIEISTAGGSDIEVVFESVANPLKLRRLVVSYNDRYDGPHVDDE